MKQRAAYWTVAAVALVLAAAWFVGRGPSLRPSVVVPKPLALVPAGPAFVLSVDLARLRGTPAGLALARAGSERLVKTGKSCGFEPLRDVDEVVIAVPDRVKLAVNGAIESVAVIAKGRFVGPVVADCVARQIQERGGEPVRTTIGSFSSVRDRRASGEIAVRNGLYVLSDGAYLRLVLDAAEGHRPDGTPLEQTRDRLHAELRRSFGEGAPVIATLTLPEGWLERTFAEPGIERSPLAQLRSAALRASATGERLEVRALLACAKPEACDPVERFLKDARQELVAALGPELGKRVSDIGLVRQGDRFELQGSLNAEETRSLFGVSQ